MVAVAQVCLRETRRTFHAATPCDSGAKRLAHMLIRSRLRIDGYLNMRSIAIALITFTAIAASHARADDYPSKPIRLIIPFAPGGVTDTTARAVTDRLGARLGQQVVIESRPGAGGNIGTEMVAKAAPDGYTLLLGFDGTLVINPHVYAKMPFDTLRDFAPITRLGDATLILVAHPSVPANTIGELAALSKQKPGTLSYGSAGNGTSGHVAAELLRLTAGVDMTHVRLKRANVNLLMGDFDAAREDCLGVLQAGAALPGTICLASAMTGPGSLERARRLLASLDAAGPAPAEVTRWRLMTEADLALRAGDVDAALAHLARAQTRSIRRMKRRARGSRSSSTQRDAMHVRWRWRVHRVGRSPGS